jgi:hypothetical protein
LPSFTSPNGSAAAYDEFDATDQDALGGLSITFLEWMMDNRLVTRPNTTSQTLFPKTKSGYIAKLHADALAHQAATQAAVALEGMDVSGAVLVEEAAAAPAPAPPPKRRRSSRAARPRAPKALPPPPPAPPKTTRRCGECAACRKKQAIFPCNAPVPCAKRAARPAVGG